MCGFECTISTSIEKYIKVKCNYIKEWYFVSFFFYLTRGNCVAFPIK